MIIINNVIIIDILKLELNYYTTLEIVLDLIPELMLHNI